MCSDYSKLWERVERVLKIVSEAIDRKDYILIKRYKNNLLNPEGYTLKLLGFTIKSLSPYNYIEGPNHNALHNNTVWVFGYDDTERKIQIYIKFSVNPEGVKIRFISFHEAEYKLKYFNWR